MKIKKSKYGDYERTVKFPVWSNYTVHIVFTDDIGASRKARYGETGASDGAHALHSSGLGGHSHLFYLIGNAPSGVIVHEAWHAIHCMLVDFGGVTIMENEVTAYHLGYLVQEITLFRNALIANNIGTQPGDDEDALKQSKVLGVKSSSRKKATHGNKDSQGSLVGVQGVSPHPGRVGTSQAGKAGTPEPSSQADGYGLDAEYVSEASGRE